MSEDFVSSYSEEPLRNGGFLMTYTFNSSDETTQVERTNVQEEEPPKAVDVATPPPRTRKRRLTYSPPPPAVSKQPVIKTFSIKKTESAKPTTSKKPHRYRPGTIAISRRTLRDNSGELSEEHNDETPVHRSKYRPGTDAHREEMKKKEKAPVKLVNELPFHMRYTPEHVSNLCVGKEKPEPTEKDLSKMVWRPTSEEKETFFKKVADLNDDISRDVISVCHKDITNPERSAKVYNLISSYVEDYDNAIKETYHPHVNYVPKEVTEKFFVFNTANLITVGNMVREIDTWTGRWRKISSILHGDDGWIFHVDYHEISTGCRFEKVVTHNEKISHSYVWPTGQKSDDLHYLSTNQVVAPFEDPASAYLCVFAYTLSLRGFYIYRKLTTVEEGKWECIPLIYAPDKESIIEHAWKGHIFTYINSDFNVCEIDTTANAIVDVKIKEFKADKKSSRALMNDIATNHSPATGVHFVFDGLNWFCFFGSSRYVFARGCRYSIPQSQCVDSDGNLTEDLSIVYEWIKADSPKGTLGYSTNWERVYPASRDMFLFVPPYDKIETKPLGMGYRNRLCWIEQGICYNARHSEAFFYTQENVHLAVACDIIAQRTLLLREIVREDVNYNTIDMENQNSKSNKETVPIPEAEADISSAASVYVPVPVPVGEIEVVMAVDEPAPPKEEASSETKPLEITVEDQQPQTKTNECLIS